MQQFIRDLLYPEIARDHYVTGTIHVYFVVQYDGVIRDVKMVRGLQPDLDYDNCFTAKIQ